MVQICSHARQPSPIVDRKETKRITTVLIEPSKVIREIPNEIFGTNVEWFQEGNGIARHDGSIRGEIVDEAKKQQITIVRFPGGTFSDYYHWKDGIGPQRDRPVRAHFTDEGKSKNVFGTPEVAHFSKAFGSQLLLTVNAGTGTAEEAAKWVHYCNDHKHALRERDGFNEPIGVRYWEVGNELYLPGNPGDINVSVKPKVYAKRYLEYAEKMKRADPSIKLLAISSSNASRYPAPNKDWLEVLMRKAASEIDMVAIHNSYFPLIFLEKRPDLKEVYQGLWAAPEAVKKNLDEISTTIKRYEGDKEIGIAITEWGSLFSFDPDWMDHVKTLGSAIYIARLLQVYIEHPRVQMANYFKFTDPTFMSWVTPQGQPKAPALAFELLSKYRGSYLISCQIIRGKTYDAKAIGAIGAEKNVPEITAIASKQEQTIFINVINRSWDTVHNLKLASEKIDWSKYHAKVHYIDSDGVTDHNGPDMPAEIMAKIKEPLLSKKAQKHGVRLHSKEINVAETISIPPFSLMTIQLSPK